MAENLNKQKNKNKRETGREKEREREREREKCHPQVDLNKNVLKSNQAVPFTPTCSNPKSTLEMAVSWLVLGLVMSCQPHRVTRVLFFSFFIF